LHFNTFPVTEATFKGYSQPLTVTRFNRSYLTFWCTYRFEPSHGQILVEDREFFILRLYSLPQTKVISLQFNIFWGKIKLERCSYLKVKNFNDTFSISTVSQSVSVMDRLTRRQTDRISKAHTANAWNVSRDN